jgi:hypothetical protein
MVAYSFKARFEIPIREGWKTQTIRAARDRHARPGEMLQLYVGMRTAQCRKIMPDVRCTDVMKVVISFDGEGVIERVITDGVPVRDLDAFAVRDGFTDIDDMSDFWRKEHGPRGLFHGVIVEWARPVPQLGAAA